MSKVRKGPLKKATCCQVLQSCCAASWRQRVKIQLVVSKKKKRSIYGRAGCREALTVEIAADFLSFFFFSPRRAQVSPLRVALAEREERPIQREKTRRGGERERERERIREEETHMHTVKG